MSQLVLWILSTWQFCCVVLAPLLLWKLGIVWGQRNEEFCFPASAMLSLEFSAPSPVNSDIRYISTACFSRSLREPYLALKHYLHAFCTSYLNTDQFMPVANIYCFFNLHPRHIRQDTIKQRSLSTFHMYLFLHRTFMLTMFTWVAVQCSFCSSISHMLNNTLYNCIFTSLVCLMTSFPFTQPSSASSKPLLMLIFHVASTAWLTTIAVGAWAKVHCCLLSFSTD